MPSFVLLNQNTTLLLKLLQDPCVNDDSEWDFYFLPCRIGCSSQIANRAKLAVPSHSEPLQWEKIGKVANQAKLAVPSHSEPLQWERLEKL